MPRGVSVTIRSFRVEDRIWEKAKRIAFQHDTTVTALIVGYLDGISSRTKLNAAQLKGEMSSFQRTRHAAAPEELAERRANCAHAKTKDVLGSKYCVECGIRVTEATA